MSKTLAFSLIFCAFLLGTGFGFIFTPEYAGLNLNKTSMAPVQRDSFSDLRYLNTMAAHHQGALLLAQEALEGTTRDEVRSLAKLVIQAKTSDLETFAAWKARWYADKKKVDPAGVVHLGTADASFDLRFINILEAKILDAMALSREVLTTSSRPEILTYASELIRIQGGILDQIRTWRAAWYAQGVPNGQ